MEQKVEVLDDGSIKIYTDNGLINEKGNHCTYIQGTFEIDAESVQKLVAIHHNKPLLQSVRLLAWGGQSKLFYNVGVTGINEVLVANIERLQKELDSRKIISEEEALEIIKANKKSFWQRLFK